MASRSNRIGVSLGHWTNRQEGYERDQSPLQKPQKSTSFLAISMLPNTGMAGRTRRAAQM